MAVALAGAQRFVAFDRVSTARQGASGLGLEAQRTAIEAFVAVRVRVGIGLFSPSVTGGCLPSNTERRR